MTIPRRLKRLEERFPRPGPPPPKIVEVVVQSAIPGRVKNAGKMGVSGVGFRNV